MGQQPQQQQGGFGGLQAMGAAALAAGGGRPTVRNPVTTLLMIWGGAVVSSIVGSIIGYILGMIVGVLSFLGTLVTLAGVFAVIVLFFKPMLLEAQTASGNQDLKWWWILVPILNIYFIALKVPEMITTAKTQAGIIQQKPTRGIAFYLFLSPYALALDLNDLVQP